LPTAAIREKNGAYTPRQGCPFFSDENYVFFAALFLLLFRYNSTVVKREKVSKNITPSHAVNCFLFDLHLVELGTTLSNGFQAMHSYHPW
jgi:hypothetical protein